MLKLGPLQGAIDRLYRLGVTDAIDDFVRPMPADAEEAARRELVLVAEPREAEGPLEIAVLLAPDVARALRGEAVRGLSRFGAWCLALEGVSHFLLLAFRAANDRPVSQLELELQAEVDKFVVALLQRARHRAASEAHAMSHRLRAALFDRHGYHDPPDSTRGRRYRAANRLAARYAARLERRYVRHGRLGPLVAEVREFYRAGLADKRAMVESA